VIQPAVQLPTKGMTRPHQSDGTKRKRVNMRDLAWTSMRIYKRFTTANIVATSGIGHDNLRKYIKALHRAGYLRLERPCQLGKSRGHAIWRLARDSGVKHPLPRRNNSGIWDQNQGKFYPCRTDTDIKRVHVTF
jgi:hypothetical protein